MADQRFISQWVTAARAGEQPAWEKLYRTFYPTVYAGALNICKSIPVAEDMVQETFLSAFTKLAQLKDPAAFEPWLKKILTHHCYRIFQKETRIHKTSFEASQEGWWENEWEQKLQNLSNRQQVHASLGSLSEILRSVLLLRYFSDYNSYEDISEILSIPVGTVRSRLNEARKKIAKAWLASADENPQVWQRAEEWNHFYRQSFESMHEHDSHKNRFVNHLEKNVMLILPGGQHSLGRRAFEAMVEDDRHAGSWLRPTNIATNENISIVEVAHFNSPEYPTHCPLRSVMILFREKTTTNKVGIHTSWK